MIAPIMAKRLTQDGIEVGQGLAALDLHTAPELWPLPQGSGEAVDLVGLYRRIGLLWRDVRRTPCQTKHLLERRAHIAVGDGEPIPLHASIVRYDLGPVVPRIAPRL